MTKAQLNHQQHQQLVWTNTVLGRHLLAQEQAVLDEVVADAFGFHALQLGCVEADFLRQSRVPNRYLASQYAPTGSSLSVYCSLYCEEDFLPFDTTSLDVLVLPHQLEFSSNPHQTLREAERVLVAEGLLLMTGFNPWSAWGALAGWRRLMRACGRCDAPSLPNDPWCGRFVSVLRLKDWLSLLGFEVVAVHYCGSLLPIAQPLVYPHFLDRYLSWVQRMFKPMSGAYCVVAKKRVAGMTPLKPHWQKAPKKAALVAR